MSEVFRPFVEDFGSGAALVAFHGFPGSHKQLQFFKPWAKKYGLRVLAPDRPGYGQSEAQPRSDLKKFILGLEEVLNEKGIEQFYLVGISGGNPAALTAAGHFGDRVLGVVSVCGLAPFHQTPEAYPKDQRKWLNVAKRTPEFLLRPMLDQLIRKFDPVSRVDELIGKLPVCDQQALHQSGGRIIMMQSMSEALRQGAAGAVFDLKSFANPWPVDLDKIQVPYAIWHGDADRVVLPDAARVLHAQVPHSRLYILAGEGHYSLPIQRAEEIFTELLASEKK